ncbi:EF-hand domain-containing protein [Roseovarius sp. MMSF_3281]|uniref:EF-hand domain-containing protein n=1 Tax=Roseovarius sp. MMSF_3281 TaxID=3046694 RepID=UPI0027402CCF|nr:EF-hand domain-containing protein [Roseovarius sp. MMSF_3281]
MQARTMILSVIGAAMVVTAGAGAMAQGKHGDHKRPSFEEVDANGDGKVSRDEMQARAAARFNDADSDGDGAISRDEMIARAMARVEKRVDRMMSRLDADDDGMVTEAEMQQMRDKHMGRMFKRMDKDGDGALSKEEFAQGHRKGHHGKHGKGKHRMGDDD